MRALGIDVSVARGLDLVLLDEDLVPVEKVRRTRPEDLPGLLRDLGPDAVAIDAPPGLGITGASRRTEAELRRFGIQSYGTPSDPGRVDHPFYAWMRIGFATFEAIAEAFPRYRNGSVKGTALEVYPHASAVVLAGCLPPRDVSKRDWRRSVLRSRDVAIDGLRSMDQIDAALASLTGILALRGRFTALGDPLEGVIVVPARSLPAQPYRRCVPPPRGSHQPPLPGLAPCGCGDPRCTRLTSREFAPGHDAKRKALLWRLARTGDEAIQELKERGWELPPEIR